MKKFVRLSALCATATLITLVSAFAESRLVVVELLTSKGGSSCPPTKTYICEFADRAIHKPLRRFCIKPEGPLLTYPSKMVGDDTSHAVDSKHTAIEAEIKQHKQSMGNGPKIDIHKENGKIIAKIGTAEANSIYHIIFGAFDKSHLTKIKRGENQGKPC